MSWLRKDLLDTSLEVAERALERLDNVADVNLGTFIAKGLAAEIARNTCEYCSQTEVSKYGNCVECGNKQELGIRD